MIQIIINDISNKVRATLLTGLSTATNAAISATDTVLSAFGKLQAQITALSNSLSNYVTNSSLATTLLGYATTSQLADKQDKRIVVSSNETAVNDGAYTLVASATFTDPSPVEGKGFSVLIRNGTATIGGTTYSTVGTTVWRIYHSGAWANYVNQLGLGFTPENVANKATDFTTINDTLYPSVEAVNEQINLKTGTTAYMTAGDVTTTSSAASNITGLSFTLEANKRYRVFGILRIGCNNTGGVNIGSTFPAGTTLNIIAFGNATSITTFRYRLDSNGTIGGVFNGFNNASGFVMIFGEVVTSGTAGNIQFQFGSGANLQTSTVFELGTWLNITEL